MWSTQVQRLHRFKDQLVDAIKDFQVNKAFTQAGKLIHNDKFQYLQQTSYGKADCKAELLQPEMLVGNELAIWEEAKRFMEMDLSKYDISKCMEDLSVKELSDDTKKPLV